MSDTIPQGKVSTQQSEASRAPSQETETPRRYSVDPKRWADHRKLDSDMKLAGFVAWHDRELRLLGSRTPERTQVVAVGGISEPYDRDD